MRPQIWRGWLNHRAFGAGIPLHGQGGGGVCEAPCIPTQASGRYWSVNNRFELLFFPL